MPEVYGQITISWTRNGESDLAGYHIYYGTSPISLNHSVDVGLTSTPISPSVTLTTFQVYGTLHFAVTAYDASNNESAFSAAVSIAVAPKLMPMFWG
jgi:hypothetical protein